MDNIKNIKEQLQMADQAIVAAMPKFMEFRRELVVVQEAFSKLYDNSAPEPEGRESYEELLLFFIESIDFIKARAEALGSFWAQTADLLERMTAYVKTLCGDDGKLAILFNLDSISNNSEQLLRAETLCVAWVEIERSLYLTLKEGVEMMLEEIKLAFAEAQSSLEAVKKEKEEFAL